MDSLRAKDPHIGFLNAFCEFGHLHKCIFGRSRQLGHKLDVDDLSIYLYYLGRFKTNVLKENWIQKHDCTQVHNCDSK